MERERFGKFLIFKKLGEDAIGEIFRAGLIGQNGIEEIVLLRVLNGPDLDPGEVGEGLIKREEIKDLLKVSSIGEIVEIGEAIGMPYVAYKYVSGKDLNTLLEKTRKKNSPIPPDHALLIAERTALALAVAYETRLRGERILHGFLVPNLIHVSNEGEIKLFGLEFAPVVRKWSQGEIISKKMGRYLSPECRQGMPPQKSDDVYSLGAILLEMLTGEKIPTNPKEALSLVEDAKISYDLTPLPTTLKELIKKSLSPQHERIPDIINWHKTLDKFMREGEYNPTTFNLAFFMHNFFKDEIEEEIQEIDTEMHTEVPPEIIAEVQSSAQQQTSQKAELAETVAIDTSTLQQATQATQAIPVGEEQEKTINTAVIQAEYGVTPAKKGSPMLLVALGVGILAVVGAGFVFMSGRGGKDTQTTPPVERVQTVAEKTPEEEALEKQLQQIEQQLELIQQQATDNQSIEEDPEIQKLKAQLEAQLRELELQRKRLLEKEKLLEEQAKSKKEDQAVAPVTPEAETAQVEEEKPQTVVEDLSTDKGKELPTLSEETTADITPPKISRDKGPSATEGKVVKKVEKPEKSASPEEQIQPKKEEVQKAETTQQTAAKETFTPPEPIKIPKARIPALARARGIDPPRMPLLVKIKIGTDGKVKEAKILNAGIIKGGGYDKEALRVVKKSIWKPATRGGQPVETYWTVSIKFER